MRLTVLGGAGAWPPAGGACSGYLIEHDGFRLLADPGTDPDASMAAARRAFAGQIDVAAADLEVELSAAAADQS